MSPTSYRAAPPRVGVGKKPYPTSRRIATSQTVRRSTGGLALVSRAEHVVQVGPAGLVGAGHHGGSVVHFPPRQLAAVVHREGVAAGQDVHDHIVRQAGQERGEAVAAEQARPVYLRNQVIQGAIR